MGASCIYTCNSCGFSLEAWDDGNPYIEFPKGKRNHFYHPGEDEVIKRVTRLIVGHAPTSEECDAALRQYAGNETDHICRSCRKETKFDPEKDAHACTRCGSADVEEMCKLAGKKCIKCDGTFSEGQFHAIS